MYLVFQFSLAFDRAFGSSFVLTRLFQHLPETIADRRLTSKGSYNDWQFVIVPLHTDCDQSHEGLKDTQTDQTKTSPDLQEEPILEWLVVMPETMEIVDTDGARERQLMWLSSYYQQRVDMPYVDNHRDLSVGPPLPVESQHPGYLAAEEDRAFAWQFQRVDNTIKWHEWFASVHGLSWEKYREQYFDQEDVDNGTNDLVTDHQEVNLTPAPVMTPQLDPTAPVWIHKDLLQHPPPTPAHSNKALDISRLNRLFDPQLPNIPADHPSNFTLTYEAPTVDTPPGAGNGHYLHRLPLFSANQITDLAPDRHFTPYLEHGFLEITAFLLRAICPADLCHKPCPYDEIYHYDETCSVWRVGCKMLRLCESIEMFPQDRSLRCVIKPGEEGHVENCPYIHDVKANCRESRRAKNRGEVRCEFVGKGEGCAYGHEFETERVEAYARLKVHNDEGYWESKATREKAKKTGVKPRGALGSRLKLRDRALDGCKLKIVGRGRRK